MKSCFISILLCCLMLFQNSCTVRIPIGNVTHTSHNGAQRVQPSYQVKKKNTKLPFFFSAEAIIIGAGFLYGNSLGLDKNGERQGTSYAVLGGFVGILPSSVVAGIFGSPARTYNQQITSKDFDKWLNSYNSKNNQNFIKYGQDSYSYLLVPKNNTSAYELEEDRLDNIVYLRVINGDLGAYNAYINSRPTTSKRYSDVLKLKDECAYYYRAMNSTLTESHTFSIMLSDCEKYLKFYPQFKGNEIFFKNVSKKYNDILAIPNYVREQQIAKIKEDAEKLRKDDQAIQDEKTLFWLGILSIFFSPSNSNGTKSYDNYEPKECTKCHGSGYYSEYQGPSNGTVRVRCYH